MKRLLIPMILLSVMVIVLFFGNNDKEKDMIKYESGAYSDKNWSETIGTYSKQAVIPNEETAVKIATAIFDGMEKNKDSQKYVPQFVFFDNQDDIWIVSFWEKSNQTVLGGNCNIAMQKKDGKVLRIWFGE